MVLVVSILTLQMGMNPQMGKVSAEIAGFPQLTFKKMLIDPVNDNLQYNPTGELISPTIFKAADYFTNPLGTYYMYVAPHDAPGGICLYYSDKLDGPWTEYANNPVISKTWSPHYNVSHVSSPNAVWVSESNKMFLYFHGENTTTRYAHTTDGINFTYGGIAVTTAMIPNATETSYARVFKYTIPRFNNTYTMTFMVNNTSNIRKCYLAYSNDGKNWTVQTTPLVSPNAQEGANIGGGEYLKWNGGHYLVYNATSGNSHITEVGANFDLENHLGVFYDPSPTGPESNKIGGVSFITVNGVLYAFADIGGRLDGKIAYYKNSDTEVIVDNAQGSPYTSQTSGWTASTGVAGYYGSNFLHDGNANKGNEAFRWTPNIPSAEKYNVYVRFTSHQNRATNAKYTVYYSGGSTTYTVDQTKNGGTWVYLGQHYFNAGQNSANGSVRLENEGTNGYVAADAVRFVK